MPMELIDDGRLAVLYLDDDDAGGVRVHEQRHRGRHQPAADRARDPGGGVLQGDPTGDVRVSMRSKYDVDVRAVASAYGGGGHKNAAGFTVAGPVWPTSRPAGHRALVAQRLKRGARPRALAPRRLAFMNGVLVIDKPAGPTSHDVVARRAPGDRLTEGRPHRHARPAGDRRAAAGHRARHATRAPT